MAEVRRPRRQDCEGARARHSTEKMGFSLLLNCGIQVCMLAATLLKYLAVFVDALTNAKMSFRPHPTQSSCEANINIHTPRQFLRVLPRFSLAYTRSRDDLQPNAFLLELDLPVCPDCSGHLRSARCSSRDEHGRGDITSSGSSAPSPRQPVFAGSTRQGSEGEQHKDFDCRLSLRAVV